MITRNDAWFCQVLVFSLAVVRSVVSSPAAPECPCLSLDWPGFAAASDILKANDFPARYGFGECRVWDENLTQTNCVGPGDLPHHCTSEWCYVDSETCRKQEEECLQQDLLINDPNHPACRARPFSQSTLFPGLTLSYSYETCGYLNNYAVENVFQGMRDTALLGAATNDLPYVSVEVMTGETGKTETYYSGVEFSFIESVLRNFDFNVDLRMIDGFATAQSRGLFSNSSYTACVHDVAVGNFDICIGDFWVTPERMLMTTFLPSMRSDQFYLVVFEDSTIVNFQRFLENPFMPFSNEAWAIIAAVVVLKALSMAILDYGPADDKHPGARYTARKFLHRAWRSFFLAWVSVFSGKAHFQSKSLPSQLATMGFQVFLLVMVASYKAKLASMLIVRNIGSGVENIDQAIEERLTICIPSAIETTVRLNYPTGKYFVYSGSSRDFARHMHNRDCDASIIHQKRIDELHAGRIREQDCEKVAAGEWTEREGRCESSVNLGTRDDCKIIKVGDIILSVPIAFPVHNGGNLLLPLSVAVTKAQNAGEWEAAVKANAHLYPQSVCEDAYADNRLGKEAFAGVSFIVGLGVALGLALRYYQHYTRTHQPPGPSAPSPDLPSSDSSSGPQPKAILDKLAEVSALVRQLEAAAGGEAGQSFQLQCDSGMVVNGSFHPNTESFSFASPRGPSAVRNGSGSDAGGRVRIGDGNGNGNGNGAVDPKISGVHLHK